MNYTITLGGSSGDSPPGVEISVEDRDGNTVTSHPVTSLTGTVEVNNARFWWPWTMKPSDPGYMYTLKVSLLLFFMVVVVVEVMVTIMVAVDHETV